ncbi:MAG: polysaccharide biosynthesis/export family protein [Micavibrio sp.]
MNNLPLSRLLLVAAMLPLSACSGSFISGSGPSGSAVRAAPNSSGIANQISVLSVTPDLTRRLTEHSRLSSFSDVFPTEQIQDEYVLGNGDIIKIVLWETPPSLLFGGSATLRDGETAVKSLDLPEQRINSEGKISVPFAGSIEAAGKTPQQLEAAILARLKGKANQPQAFVQIADNRTKSVTMVGDFNENTHFPLTSKGERLLDAIAAAGGVKQAVDKVTIQMARNDIVRSMPMDRIIRDPHQNIQLLPGDVIMALDKPLSLSVLGATQKNEEIAFETQGITLAQAMARAGGLQDQRADASGIFIFRFEDPEIIGRPAQQEARAAAAQASPLPITPAGMIDPVTVMAPAALVPVIYTLNLKDPASFFLAQNFQMKDKDVLYVSNAPAADLQKFMNIITTGIYSVLVPVNTFK